MIDFSGRIALVTGASRGIGRRIAEDLSRAGATLIVTSTDPADADELIAALGDGTRHLAVDFLDRGQTEAFFQRVRALDALDVLINNAGLTRHGPFETATADNWDATHDVDLKAPYFLTQAAASVMTRRRYGRVVNISSIWGHITMQDRSIYTAAKFGLRGMSISHAVELAPHNVLVNVVSPGFTMTDMVRKNYTTEKLDALSRMVPLLRLAEPGDISSAVLFLASELNTYITGQCLVVDGGYSVT